MTRRGFILGKFMPPHRGHLFLCETALNMTDELTVLVCSTDDEPIGGARRFEIMRDMLPQARVLHLHKNLPQAPEDHPDFWAIWRSEIKAHHPEGVTHVFASEPYVFRLAQELDAAPVLVDPDREIFLVSGTMLRAAPAQDLKAPPKSLRPQFQKRLTLLGPESVGKSRLAADLAAHFGTRAMPEYGRIYDVHYKQGKNWRADDLVALAETHRAMREAMRDEAGPLLIEDTDAVQTAVWSLFVVGEIAPALEQIERETLADHYLLLTPDVAWTQDGVRYAGDDKTRRFFFEEAERRLKSLGAKYYVISGNDFDERRAQALALAQKLCGGAP